jgi:hypothetical protein
MSLFEEASLVITPNGFKAGKLYAIKPTSGAGDLSVVRATSATRVNANGIIETVASNVPRIDYSGGGCPSILVEPQRTNVVLRSQEFDNISWSQSNATIISNQLLSPSGTLTADKLNEKLEDTAQWTLQEHSQNGTFTFSTYAKSAERRYICLITNAGNNTYFDLQDGTIISVGSGVTANIENFGNGWYRCVVTANISTSFPYVIICNSDNGNRIGYLGDPTKGIYIWGAQLEQGSYPTSYIPTVASSVTRNADVISKTGISSSIGQTEGTLYTEIKVNKLIGAASRYIFHLSDGTANNRIYIAFSGAASNVLRARIFNGGTLQCSINTSALTTTGTYKLALAYKNNDIVFYVNGVQIGTDIVATIPTCSRVDLGQNYAGASQLSDNISLSTLFKTRLTNAELAELTTL